MTTKITYAELGIDIGAAGVHAALLNRIWREYHAGQLERRVAYGRLHIAAHMRNLTSKIKRDITPGVEVAILLTFSREALTERARRNRWVMPMDAITREALLAQRGLNIREVLR